MFCMSLNASSVSSLPSNKYVKTKLKYNIFLKHIMGAAIGIQQKFEKNLKRNFSSHRYFFS